MRQRDRSTWLCAAVLAATPLVSLLAQQPVAPAALASGQKPAPPPPPVFRSGVAAAARSLALELAPRATITIVVTGQFDTPALGRFETLRDVLRQLDGDPHHTAHLTPDRVRTTCTLKRAPKRP